jgi:hemerythrin superfamily protein
MHVFELIRNDHRMVNEIIEELVQCEEPDDCRALFERLHRELEAHARVEEDHFYPALREAAQAGAEVRDGREEHEQMRELMSRMEGMEPASDDWLDTLLDLRDLIEHHVADEEEEMFAQAEDGMPEERLRSMGEEMEQEKQRLLQG